MLLNVSLCRHSPLWLGVPFSHSLYTTTDDQNATEIGLGMNSGARHRLSTHLGQIFATPEKKWSERFVSFRPHLLTTLRYAHQKFPITKQLTHKFYSTYLLEVSLRYLYLENS